MSTTSLRSSDTVLRPKRRPQSTPKAPNPTAPKPLNTAANKASELSSSSTWWRQPASVYNSLVATVSMPFNARADQPVAFSKNEDLAEVKPNELDEENRKAAMKVDLSPEKPKSRSVEYSAYLNPVGYLETRYTRMMASLSSIAYRMDRLTPAYLRRMHNIELRHTSLACEIGFKNEVVSPERQMAEDVDILGDGMAGMAPSFTETALIEEVQQPQRPPEPISSASELAAARAYDHFHPSIPRSSTVDSMDSDRPAILEGYTVWSPSRPKRRHRRSSKSKATKGTRSTNDDSSSTMTTYTRLAEGLGSVDTDPDHQHSMPPEFQTPAVSSLDSDSSDNHDDVYPASPHRFYESEPLLVGALADRAQWWDYEASVYSDMETDGMLSDVDDISSETSSIEGSKPQSDMFCALDMLARVWPNKKLASSSQSAAADTQTSGTVVDEDMAGSELKDFAGGMEGDIMQAAANATASMNPSDTEEVGYLEKLRQRVLAVSTVKEVTFAAGAARKPPRRAGVPKPDTRDSEGHSCPVHWFVADDPSSNIRFFSLQGSDSLDSWRANLSFDPVTFEDASLGVSVHRGMYEAALALYPRFAPMVAEHLASSPFARISFTGHSLGGSISTILAIMMVHRKLVRPSQLSPLYTFGAAACFCEADHVEQIACGRPVSGDVTDAEADNMDMNSRSSSGVDSGLLRSLGIPCDTVRNIILTHDIVPRAFACDYTPVAAMLRQVFTKHLGLQCDDRSIMYHFVGRLLVLQPDEDLSWVYDGEGHHPLLPKKAGLYELIEPDMLSRTRQLALSSMDALESLLASESRRRPSGVGISAHNSRVSSAGGSGAGFLPSAWLRRRGEVTNSRSSVSSAATAAASDDATCSAVEGYPSPCSQPLAATASLGRQAYWQSLATRVPMKNASTFTIDLEAQLGPDLSALLSPFNDRKNRAASAHVPATVPPSVPFSTMDESDLASERSKTIKASGTGPQSKPLVASTAPAIASTRDTLHHAELAMLDTPHPLKVLADPGAYGDHGMISRFHHPDHYTQALGSVVRSNLAPFRRVVGRVNMSRFSTLLRARLRRLQADPMAAWHSAVWDLQAVIAAEGERLDLRPSGPVFGTASLLERTGINVPELPNKFP